MAKKIKVQNFTPLSIATLGDYNASRVRLAELQVAKKSEIKKLKDRLDFLNDILADKSSDADLIKATNDEIVEVVADIEKIENGYKMASKPLNKIMNECKKTVPSELFATYSAVISNGTEEDLNRFSLACMKWLVSLGCENIDETAISKFGAVYSTMIGGTRRNTAENISDGQSLRVSYTENTFKSLAIEGLIDYMINVMKSFIINDNNRLDLKYKDEVKVA